MSKYTESMLKIVEGIDSLGEFKFSHPAKISNRARCAFSVPAGPKFACPGATDSCKDCYAQKGRHVFENVQSVMANNWKLLKKFERYNQTELCVESIINKMNRNAEVFRIYESGDFHSQWVVDMWAEVVRRLPHIKFWAYTRSFEFSFTALTRNKNFALWASTDPYNFVEAKRFVRRFRKSGTKHAYGPWEGSGLPANSITCPATSGYLKIDGACEKCMICVIKNRVKKNIVFLKH